MDGSAVFLTGITKMLSLNPNITVDLVLATPIQRDILLKELYDLKNVNIISPFDDEDLISANPKWYMNQRFTHEEAAHMLNYYWTQRHYDWIIIRGIEVVNELYRVNENIFDKLMTYVTGITFEDQIIPEEEWKEKYKIFKRSAHLLCQTDEMKKFITKKFPDLDTKIITLNPMVPNTTKDFNEVFVKKERYNKLCYVGKFHHDWNSVPMIVGFREIKETHPDAKFLIAGDKFTNHPEYPNYNKELKYLLTNTENLTWFGALSREDSRALIAEGDIGISWRAEKMNTSLELSVKLLEYGTFGKAVVMNRTPMHEKIFGEDYPLYVGSLQEFEDAINAVIEDPSLYYKAAKRMFEASQKFTYTETLNKLTPYLFESKLDEFLRGNGYEIKEKWSTTEKSNTLIIDKNGREFVLSKIELCEPANLIEYLNLVSGIGKIINYYQENRTLYTIIEKDDDTLQNNMEFNFNTDIFQEILEFMVEQSVLEHNYEKDTKLLKYKSKLQFGFYNDNKEKIVNRTSVNEMQKKLKKLEKIEKKYKALANSKLGRLTLKYWKIKNK